MPKKMHLKKGDFINIQEWMVEELNLKGNELMIFAKIFGFSTTEEQYFTGRLQYLMTWITGTKATVISTLNSLVQKGYIEKIEEVSNGVKYCKYRTLVYPGDVKAKSEVEAEAETEAESEGYKNYTSGTEIEPGDGIEIEPGWYKNYTGGGSKIEPIHYNRKNITDDISTTTGTERSSDKASYAEILELYNSICKSLPKVIKLNEHRRKAIRARLHDGYSIDDIKRAFELAEASPFLRGEVTTFHADFDWIMCDTNLPKVLENKYKERKTENPQTNQPEIDTEHYSEDFLKLIGAIP